MPKISVITPVYNGSKYLGIALDSLFAQTFMDWELIVIDDGSTDETPEILAQYVDSRCTIIRQTNSGEATSRNVGLEHAHGEYIAFLDADDIFLPNALADLSGFLDIHPEYGVVFSDGYLCDENGKTLTRLTEHRPGIFTGNILEPLILSASVITVPICTMTRRSIIEEHNIRFDKNLTIGPDWDFWIQLACYTHFSYLDKLTCMYRVHLTNITRTSGKKKRYEDLVYGRMKVMKAEWFQDLSEHTRKIFFSNLLIELLGRQPDRQLAILQGEPFKQLPAAYQSQLWRQVGICRMLMNIDRNDIYLYLTTAISICPNDMKSRVLVRLLRFNQSIAFNLVRMWQYLNKLTFNLHFIGKHKPKPVPTALRPVEY